MKSAFLPALFPSLLFFLFPSSANAQQLWKKVYDLGVSAQTYSAVETDDHDFLVLGKASTNDSLQLLLMKVGPNGDLLWQKRFPGVADDSGRGIVRTADNHFLIIGSSSLYMILLKVNAEGEQLWKRYIKKDRAGIGLDLTADGGIVALGNYTTPLNGILISYVFVAKLDSMGNEVWSNTYFQQVDAWPEAIEQTADGGYIIGGTHQYNTTAGGFLLKLTGSGAVSWFRTYENSNIHDDYFHFAATTRDGGYVLCGSENSIIQPPVQQSPDAYIIRTDASGQPTGYYLVGVANAVESANHIFQNDAEQFVIAGETDEPDGNKNVLLALLSPTGTTLQKCFFGTPDRDYGHSALEASDHSILVVGHTSLISVNRRNPFLVKTNWQCSTVTGALPEPAQDGIAVYPNPSAGMIHVDLPPDAGDGFSVELFDTYGQRVSTSTLQPGSNGLNIAHLASGVYFYRLLRQKVCLKTSKIILL
ncbi:MAG: T9SS type A sorting domain-containing protein [Saprospiraceae bacterium]|nr:T9SS type A sorting domain-containing protein [Saprospiraceae bacterium]